MIVCFVVCCLYLLVYVDALRRGTISGIWERMAFGMMTVCCVVVIVGVLVGRIPLL